MQPLCAHSQRRQVRPQPHCVAIRRDLQPSRNVGIVLRQVVDAARPHAHVVANVGPNRNGPVCHGVPIEGTGVDSHRCRSGNLQGRRRERIVIPCWPRWKAAIERCFYVFYTRREAYVGDRR